MPCLANNHQCTGCMGCVDACPTKALATTINNEGHYTYKLNQDLCIECKKCERTCPVVSGYNYGENCLSKSIPFAGWNNNHPIRQNSTSGGVFSALALHVLSQGGVVVGSMMDKFSAKHIIIENPNDLKKLQGSKYTQSDTTGVYIAVKKKLEEGKLVLFSGLGCQISALNLFLKGVKSRDNLYTVDLICGGVPSSFLIKRFQEEYSSTISGIYSFRDKMQYKLSVFDMSNEVKSFPPYLRPLPLCGFTSELTNRYSCYDCHYAFAHRKSDMTIGDFWGDTKFQEEHEDGLSIIITHTDKGRLILDKSDITFHPVEWKDFLKRNFRMVEGKEKYPKKVRANLSNAFKNYSYKRLQEEYGNTASITQPFLFGRKVYRYLRRRFHLIHIRKCIDKLLKAQ